MIYKQTKATSKERLLDIALWSVLAAGGFSYGFFRSDQSDVPLACIIVAGYVVAGGLYFLVRNRGQSKRGR